MIKFLTPFGLLLIITGAQAADSIDQTSKILDLPMVITAAQANDPWLVGNKHMQDSVLSMSVAVGALPDPKMSIGLANMPLDSFNFGQEAMTQAKVGISQAFPPGDTRAIRQRQLELKGSQFPYQRQDRRAKIAVTVGQLWLNAYKAQESITIIEKKRTLFEQLADVAQSSYASALGKTRQQDIIRAQLELIRLDDRLTVLHQRQEMFQQQLAEWLNDFFRDRYSENSPNYNQRQAPGFSLTRNMPDIPLLNMHLYRSSTPTNPEILFEEFADHPAMQALEQKIRASKASIDLAQQKYKPAWAINAGYGYRASDPMGQGRSDFISAGVTFSVPLFTARRQDKEVQSARSRTSAVKTEKWQLLRKLMASFETAKAQLLHLDQRQTLYQVQLLPQMHEQAEAAISAYTHDDGDFAEVVRARIAEMDAEIDALNINVDRQKTILQLNYFFMKQPDEIIARNRRSGDLK